MKNNTRNEVLKIADFIGEGYRQKLLANDELI